MLCANQNNKIIGILNIPCDKNASSIALPLASAEPMDCLKPHSLPEYRMLILPVDTICAQISASNELLGGYASEIQNEAHMRLYDKLGVTSDEVAKCVVIERVACQSPFSIEFRATARAAKLTDDQIEDIFDLWQFTPC